MKNKIQPSDHERMRDNFCLRQLRNECEKGKGLFSNNFSTMNGKLPDNHVTVLAFAPGNDSQEKIYILLRKAGQEYFMWSIANQYVSSTCDYFIYLDAKHNSYQMFSSRAGTPLPPVICNDYEGSKIEYVRKYVVEEDQEMVMREMQNPGSRRSWNTTRSTASPAGLWSTEATRESAWTTAITIKNAR